MACVSDGLAVHPPTNPVPPVTRTRMVAALWLTSPPSFGVARSSGYRRLAAKFAPWPTMPFTAYRPCATGLLPSPQIDAIGTQLKRFRLVQGLMSIGGAPYGPGIEPTVLNRVTAATWFATRGHRAGRPARVQPAVPRSRGDITGHGRTRG